MHLHATRTASRAGLLLLLTFVSAGTTGAAARQAALARIEKVVVEGQSVSQPSTEAVKVIRAGGDQVLAGQVGTELYADDRLITGPAKVVLVSLDASGDKDRRVVVGENTSLVVLKQSVSLTFGRIWVKVRGAFAVRTVYWLLGVPGTEFFFEVRRAAEPGKESGPERANLAVLEGAVDVTLHDADPATRKSQAAPAQGKAAPASGRSLRVKNAEEVNLLGGSSLPPAAQPLSREKYAQLKQELERVESAKIRPETPVPSPISPSEVPPPVGWKTVTGAGLSFDVPSYFWEKSDTAVAYLPTSPSPQSFNVSYLSAGTPGREMFASAGHGYIQIPLGDEDDLNDFALELIFRRLGTVDLPEIGPLMLDIPTLRLIEGTKRGVYTIRAVAFLPAARNIYTVYFAMTFRNTGDGRVKMVYIYTGCVQTLCGPSADGGVLHILKTFKESDGGSP